MQSEITDLHYSSAMIQFNKSVQHSIEDLLTGVLYKDSHFTLRRGWEGETVSSPIQCFVFFFF